MGTLKEDMGGDDDLLPEAEDIEVSFIEDESPAPTSLAPRRGQNEDQDGGVYADADLDDIENPRIRDRIMRERRLAQQAAQQKNQEADRYEAALRDSEKQKLSIQHDAFKLSLDGVDVRIRTAMEALKLAKSEGDDSAAVDIDGQLSELRSIRDGIKSQMERLPSEQDIDRAFEEAAARRRAQSRVPTSGSKDNVRPLNEKAGRWQANNSWMLDPSRSAETAALMAINNQLVNEGLDANDDRFFVELSRRMAKTFPGLPIKDLSGRQLTAARQAQQRNDSPPVAGVRSSATAPPSGMRRSNPRQVELDRTDRAMMRSFGLDPSNPSAVKYYAKEKYMRQLAEQKGGA